MHVRQVFLNIVLDDAVEEKDGGEKVRLGMVVIRGNSVVMLEVSFVPSPSLCPFFPFPFHFLPFLDLFVILGVRIRRADIGGFPTITGA